LATQEKMMMMRIVEATGKKERPRPACRLLAAWVLFL
jgi:hypothetical protein